MKIKDGKIAEATEAELFEHYLKSEFDDLMPFAEYKKQFIKLGTKIIE